MGVRLNNEHQLLRGAHLARVECNNDLEEEKRCNNLLH